MNCPNCKGRNPIGNKFCRECGQKLPLEENLLAAEEAQQAEAERNRERAAKLLTESFSLSQHGKPAEALPLAQEAAELLPESTSALTLCATLYERLGQNDKAIAAMEKVVALNPDSAVDADKLDRLRRGVHLLPRRPTVVQPEQERGKRPLVIAVATGIVAFCVGVFAIVQVNRPAPAQNQQQKPRVSLPPVSMPPAVTAERISPPASSPNSGFGPLSAPQTVKQEARPDPFAPMGRTLMGATPPPTPRTATNPVLPAPGAPIPAGPPVGETAPLFLSNTPPSGTSGRGLPPLGGIQRNTDPITARAPQSQGNGPGIPAGPPPTANNGQEKEKEAGGNPPAPIDNPGFIRIRDHSVPGEGGVRTSSNLPNDPLLKAQTLQASGKYREAIIAYRDALVAGAVAGEVQQGIALCYQRLGEKSSARTAYQQAIQAFEAQVRAGRGIEQASRGLAACRAALTVLGQIS